MPSMGRVILGGLGSEMFIGAVLFQIGTSDKGSNRCKVKRAKWRKASLDLTMVGRSI